jgi:hypothetical protein
MFYLTPVDELEFVFNYSIKVSMFRVKVMDYPCTIHEENKGFPKSHNAGTYLKDCEDLPQDIVNYLSVAPKCTRRTGAWRWCAPNEICRHESEPGFRFAVRDLGMGYAECLVWLHMTGHWDKVTLGGSCAQIAERTHEKWLAHQGVGDVKNIQSLMRELE